MVKDILSTFKNMSALDVACGYGRFAECFKEYTGIDFCEEFIVVAKRDNPNKLFICVDAHSENSIEPVDIVFSVISLSSLNMTPQEFNEKWNRYAKYAVMVFEVDEFFIFPKL